MFDILRFEVRNVSYIYRGLPQLVDNTLSNTLSLGGIYLMPLLHMAVFGKS